MKHNVMTGRSDLLEGETAQAQPSVGDRGKDMASRQGKILPSDVWDRVKMRLKTSVGEDVYTSWFARLELEEIARRSRPSFGAYAFSVFLDPVQLCRAHP